MEQLQQHNIKITRTDHDDPEDDEKDEEEGRCLTSMCYLITFFFNSLMLNPLKFDVIK